MRPIIASLAFVLLPLPVAAQGDMALRLAMVELIRASGCVLDQAGSDAMPTQLCATVAEMAPVAADLFLDGLMTVSMADAPMANLTAGLCDPGGVDARTALVAQFRLHGCALTEDEGERILLPLGLTRETVQPAAVAMTEAGELSAVDSMFRLSDALCVGAGDPLPAPRGLLIARLAASGCRMDGGDAQTVMAMVTGLEDSLLTALADRMLERGELYQDGTTLVLASSLCALDLPAPIPMAEAAPVDVRAAVIAALNANGCAMTEDDGPALLKAQGVTMDDSEPVVDAMIGAGEATFADDLLTLSPALCVQP